MFSMLQCHFFNPLVSTYAYVTYQDIKQLGNLKDQTVIVVKAPTDTKLEVPDPDEVCALAGRKCISLKPCMYMNEERACDFLIFNDPLCVCYSE